MVEGDTLLQDTFFDGWRSARKLDSPHCNISVAKNCRTKSTRLYVHASPCTWSSGKSE